MQVELRKAKKKILGKFLNGEMRPIRFHGWRAESLLLLKII